MTIDWVKAASNGTVYTCIWLTIYEPSKRPVFVPQTLLPLSLISQVDQLQWSDNKLVRGKLTTYSYRASRLSFTCNLPIALRSGPPPRRELVAPAGQLLHYDIVRL